MEDTLQTHPIEKRNANNLVGRARNDVTDKLPICLYFVIFNKPTHNETFVIASCPPCAVPAKGVQLLPYVTHPSLRSTMTAKKSLPDADKPATLKMLAEYLDLSPATVSIVLNNSPVATSIPVATKQRVHAAAKKFDYRPNLHARMLRSRLTNTIGVIVPELSEGYVTGVMLGVEQYLLQEGF